MKKLILSIAVLLTTTLTLNAQNNISVEVYQDARLLVVGDKEHGYEPLTLDLIFRFNLQGNQDRLGYFSAGHEFETAQLKGGYERYTLHAGYTFNRFEYSEYYVSLGFGFIDRFDGSFFSSNVNLSYKYKISDRFKFVLTTQIAERKDLKVMYNSNPIKVSGFFGFEVNLK